MAERIVGLFKGTEEHRNVLYSAFWTQTEGVEQTTIYRISITRSNHGNIYHYLGPETVKSGSRIDGFATGRPEKFTIGRIRLDTWKLDEWAKEVNQSQILQPHDFVVALLKKIESFEGHQQALQEKWSFTAQEWWDTQDLIIPTKCTTESKSRPYNTKVTEKYDSLHQTVENCPTTDGNVKIREQRECYDPRSPPGLDPVRDGHFRSGSKPPTPLQSPAPLQSPTQASSSTRLHRTQSTPVPIRVKLQPPLQTRSNPETPVTGFPRYYSMPPPPMGRPEYRHYPSAPFHPAPDPHMRPYQSRRQSTSTTRSSSISYYDEPIKPPAVKPPRSKEDRKRSESRSGRHHERQDTMTKVLKLLAATALAIP